MEFNNKDQDNEEDDDENMLEVDIGSNQIIDL